MIVTEYMENGSLDAFLRVRVPRCLPRGGRGVQSGCWEIRTDLQTPTGAWTQWTWGRGVGYREDP